MNFSASIALHRMKNRKADAGPHVGTEYNSLRDDSFEFAALFDNDESDDDGVGTCVKDEDLTPDLLARIHPHPIKRLKKIIIEDMTWHLHKAKVKTAPKPKKFRDFLGVYTNMSAEMSEGQNAALLEFIEEAMALAIKQAMDEHVVKITQVCYGAFILEFIIEQYDDECVYLDGFNGLFNGMKQKLKVYSMQSYVKSMIKKVYKLFIEDFPHTRTEVYHLMKVMQAIQWFGRDELVDTLIADIKFKCLRMGVTTKNILTAYANAVECLSHFDHSAALVHKVCAVIRAYVTTRPETIKTIIRFITAARPGGHAREKRSGLMMSDKLMESINDEYVLAKDEAAKKNWESWMPDPYDCNPYESKLVRTSADVFSMLVMIYGSKEMFVKEYRDFLAERLMANGCGILENEKSYVEMMKYRFHAGELTNCDVMLKDIKESQKIGELSLPEIDIRVISDAFWPTAKDVAVPQMEILDEVRKKYAIHFENTKLHRKLRWYKSHGAYVTMSVGIGDRLVDIKVDMLHYSVIALFLEKEEYAVQELAAVIELPSGELDELVDWWVKMGCLTREGTSIRLIEDQSSWTKLEQHAREQKSHDGSMEEEVDDEEEKNADEINILDEMESYWNYIKQNMKMNHRPNAQHAQQLTPERLLSVFTMLLTDSETPLPSLDDVVAFMGRKIRQNLIYMDNGVYYPTKDLLEEGKS